MIEYLLCTALPCIYNHHHAYEDHDDVDHDDYDHDEGAHDDDDDDDGLTWEWVCDDSAEFGSWPCLFQPISCCLGTIAPGDDDDDDDDDDVGDGGDGGDDDDEGISVCLGQQAGLP